MSPASLQDRDVRLVCDAAVQLACCGVATALQSVVEQATQQHEAPPSGEGSQHALVPGATAAWVAPCVVSAALRGVLVRQSKGAASEASTGRRGGTAMN